MYEKILGATVNNSGVYCFRLRQCWQRQKCGRKNYGCGQFLPHGRVCPCSRRQPCESLHNDWRRHRASRLGTFGTRFNAGVEPWAQPALDAVADEGVLPVEAGKAFMAEQNSRLDPHFWLSPRKAETEVLAVRDAFIKVDPANAAAYEKNAADYIERLKELDRKMAAVTQNAQIKTFVTTHAAFGHLAADYGLKQISIMGLSPQSEPSPAALNKLVGVMHAENIKYVFFETLVSPRIAESIAAEAGARTLVLDPIEGLSGEGRRSGDDYLKIMERNIKNLGIALNGKEE